MIALSSRRFFYIGCFFFIGSFVLKNSLLHNVYSTSCNMFTYSLIKIANGVCKPFIYGARTLQNMKSVNILIEQVMQENSTLKEQLIALQSVQDFHQDTKDLIAFQQRYDNSYKQLMHILHVQYSPQQHYMLLDGGYKQGIEIDMVAVYKNCLLGKVIEVFPHYCKVLLITDEHCGVSVYCAQTKTEGIHEGMNQQDVSVLKHVSHLEKLQEQDLLISSGKGLVFPRGFGIGRIQSFELENVQYKVTVKPLIDPSTLKYCYVMTKGAEKNTSTIQIDAPPAEIVE